MDPNDRRSNIVRITPLGQTSFEHMAVAHRQGVDTLLAGVPEPDRLVLHRMLGSLARSLDAMPCE